ncbi:MAG: hypothetical protein GY723_09430 [bacterium]|nr:hypothetical protein [bacterium]MCP5070131.1 hypothetical protein [bacterium]
MRVLWSALGIAAFVGLLVLATLRTGQVECEVCVVTNAGSHCARAAGKDREEATIGALRTACGTAAGAMDDELACTKKAPQRISCEP